VRFHGPHRDGQSYPVNACVQRSGHLWIATRNAGPHDVPGLHGDEETDASPDSPWVLAVRRGRDAGKADLRALDARIGALEAAMRQR
jgi:hypothetical protein